MTGGMLTGVKLAITGKTPILQRQTRRQLFVGFVSPFGLGVQESVVSHAGQMFVRLYTGWRTLVFFMGIGRNNRAAEAC